jgi:hypothetical protein
MAVLAVCQIARIVTVGTGAIGVFITGISTDGTVDFTGNVNPPIGMPTVSWNDGTVNADIEAFVKLTLQSSPYNMTFGGSDTVLLIPT